jgi:hypothetical protein
VFEGEDIKDEEIDFDEEDSIEFDEEGEGDSLSEELIVEVWESVLFVVKEKDEGDWRAEALFEKVPSDSDAVADSDFDDRDEEVDGDSEIVVDGVTLVVAVVVIDSVEEGVKRKCQTFSHS